VNSENISLQLMASHIVYTFYPLEC